MKNLHMPVTSHTVVLSQLADLEDAVMKRAKGHEFITADELGLTAAPLLSEHRTETLPADAVLERIWWDGPSEYPFIYAGFRHESTEDQLLADLHTAALQALSHRVKLRQSWGF
jgi:hypothetical protein